MSKRTIGINVLEAARNRINIVFDKFPKIYLSFSGGKDSSVMFHLVAEIARQKNKKFGVLIVDLEAQYKLTIDHINSMVEEYKDIIDLYWVALPIALRNAVSVYEPKWKCWDKNSKNIWVREPDNKSITDEDFSHFLRTEWNLKILYQNLGHGIQKVYLAPVLSVSERMRV